ncbi:Fucose mutarotase [Orchesella cincta]|uniref:L-fucose mutarotase n=1 Tax=Orchesella cincta TaxID=48709 RepID=A0A1D2N002_ORCCI|nr:Fucose mutarotase [Orchesella cincta]
MGLKGVPSIISPDLLKALAEMGHGDNIVIADAHFPAHSLGRRGPLVIRADGVKYIADMMAAILKLIDLDAYVPNPVKIMDLTDDDKKKGILKTPLPVWQQYIDIASKSSNGQKFSLGYVERFEFYEQAAGAFVIVLTSDTTLYGNVMLSKGVLPVE